VGLLTSAKALHAKAWKVTGTHYWNQTRSLLAYVQALFISMTTCELVSCQLNSLIKL